MRAVELERERERGFWGRGWEEALARVSRASSESRRKSVLASSAASAAAAAWEWVWRVEARSGAGEER